MDWPAAELVTSARLALQPVSVEHARAMVEVLADAALYEYTGGEAPSLQVLVSRYAAQSRGCSPDGAQGWLNWVVIDGEAGRPVGFVQATVDRQAARLVADIAWVISPPWQRRGIASEAARLMLDWLRSEGVHDVTAHIHPAHQASMRVARNLGLHATTSGKHGETRWESPSATACSDP